MLVERHTDTNIHEDILGKVIFIHFWYPYHNFILHQLCCSIQNIIYIMNIEYYIYRKAIVLVKHLDTYYRVCKKNIGFRNVAYSCFRGVLVVKIRVFWGAEHIYAMTRCRAHVPNLSALVWTPIYLLTHLWMTIW